MRTILSIISLVFLILISACNSKKDKAENTKSDISQVELQTISFDVEGMTCTGCEQTIQTNLKKIEGIQLVTASHTAKTTVVSFDPQKTDTTAIKQTIAGSGYEVTGITQSVE